MKSKEYLELRSGMSRLVKEVEIDIRCLRDKMDSQKYYDTGSCAELYTLTKIRDKMVKLIDKPLDSNIIATLD